MRETVPYGLIAGEAVGDGITVDESVGVDCDVGVAVDSSVGTGVAIGCIDGAGLHPLRITPNIAQNKKMYVENRSFRVIILTSRIR
jgi:hypothetical protein